MQLRHGSIEAQRCIYLPDTSLPAYNLRKARKVNEVIPETVRTNRFGLSAAEVPGSALSRAAGQSSRVRCLGGTDGFANYGRCEKQGCNQASLPCIHLHLTLVYGYGRSTRSLTYCRTRQTIPDISRVSEMSKCDTLVSDIPHEPQSSRSRRTSKFHSMATSTNRVATLVSTTSSTSLR